MNDLGFTIHSVKSVASSLHTINTYNTNFITEAQHFWDS